MLQRNLGSLFLRIHGTESFDLCCMFVESTYCHVDIDSSLLSEYVNMIGPLSEFVMASNSFKIVLRYFGKV